MPRIKFNASITPMEAPPNDDYLVEVVSMEMKRSKAQNDYISTQLKIISDKMMTNSDGTESPIGGKVLFTNFALVPQSGWVLKDFLEASGVPHTATPGAQRGEFEIDFDTADAIGMKLVVTTKQEGYKKNDGTNGIKAEVDKFHPVS